MKQVSIETAQSSLDCSVLRQLPSKTIILGVLSLSDLTVETPVTVAERIRRALPHVPAERILVARDCGLKYLPREAAFGKMKTMVEVAGLVAPGTRSTLLGSDFCGSDCTKFTTPAGKSALRSPAYPRFALSLRSGRGILMLGETWHFGECRSKVVSVGGPGQSLPVTSADQHKRHNDHCSQNDLFSPADRDA